MSWVALFPGQGSQHPKMGIDLFEDHKESLIDKFEMIMGWSLKEVCEFSNEEELKKTCLLYTSPRPRDKSNLV